MTKPSVHLRFLAAAASLALLLTAFATLLGGATVSAATDEAHPAHIHSGTCPAPGAIVYNLDDVSDAGLIDGTPVAIPGEVGQAPSLPIQQSDTTVKSTLKALTDGNHSIVVHESMANINDYLVCGNIGGTMFGSNDLSIALAPVKDSGYSGVATMHDNGDGTTAVYLFLVHSAAPANAATPASTGGALPGAAASPAVEPSNPVSSPAVETTPVASPAASAAAGGGSQTAVTLDLVDIAFQPDQFTIPANTDVTVTLKNTGASDHDFSVTDHDNSGVKNLNISVAVPAGQTKTVTINAPAGDYYFFCNVPGHEAAGMHGTMHVK